MYCRFRGTFGIDAAGRANFIISTVGIERKVHPQTTDLRYVMTKLRAVRCDTIELAARAAADKKRDKATVLSESLKRVYVVSSRASQASNDRQRSLPRL